MDEAAGTHALATGGILLLAIQRPDGVAYKYDDTNPDARTARLLAGSGDSDGGGAARCGSAGNELVHETGARYIDFVVPGLLGMNLMGSAMWGLGFSIVEARQKKLLKRLVASPMPRWQYLMSFLLSRLAMLVIEVVVFLGFARLAFGVPFRGSLWELGLLCVLTSLAFSALGLLVSSRARTMEAASGLMNLVMLPMWILSGVFFSASRFPAAIQPLVRALPLTAAIDAMRGNMLQGMNLGQLMVPVVWEYCWRGLLCRLPSLCASFDGDSQFKSLLFHALRSMIGPHAKGRSWPVLSMIREMEHPVWQKKMPVKPAAVTGVSSTSPSSTPWRTWAR
jgi:ABC-2 type transport system permease protein